MQIKLRGLSFLPQARGAAIGKVSLGALRRLSEVVKNGGREMNQEAAGLNIVIGISTVALSGGGKDVGRFKTLLVAVLIGLKNCMNMSNVER